MAGASAVILTWWRGYGRADLRGDVTAGLVVAVLVVPQAMAYAMLAGLPPVMGLYAATVPLLAYALLGTSRQLAVGPVAMVSLLVAEACAVSGPEGVVSDPSRAVLLAVMVGVLQVSLGLLRAGFLVNFVSHAVVSGFTSAGAILIALSQLRHVLGVPLSGGTPLAVLADAWRRLGEVHLATLVLAVGALVVLLLGRARRWRVPAMVPVLLVATVLVAWFDLGAHGVSTVGAVPGGLPSWVLPEVSRGALLDLLPSALVIVFISSMESMAVAQWIATRERYRIDANREFLGLGLANLAAGLFAGYAVAGGFSRTAVNYQSGARTRLAGVITAALVVVTLLALTPLFTHLPNAVLAAVIMVAAVGLVDLDEARRLFRVKPADGWTFGLTFAVTLAAGMDRGLVAGIVLSLLLLVARTSRPRVAILGRVGAADEFRDVRVYPSAVTVPGVVIIRVDASLYFANARFVEDRIRGQLLSQPPPRWVVMDMSGVNDIDAVAVTTLADLMKDCEPLGVRFAFAGMKAQIRRVVEASGWPAILGERLAYPSLSQALAAVAVTPPAGAVTASAAAEAAGRVGAATFTPRSG